MSTPGGAPRWLISWAVTHEPAAARPVTHEHAPSRSQDLVSEPAWPWPIDITRYDPTLTLTPPEAAALSALAEQTREWRRPRTRRGAWHGLHRLVRPLGDVRASVSTPGPHRRRSADTAVAVLLRMCAVEQAPYWAWSAATWVRIREQNLIVPARRLAAHGLKAWDEVQRRGYEGLVAKDDSSPYAGGRTLSWLKSSSATIEGPLAASSLAARSKMSRQTKGHPYTEDVSVPHGD